MAKLRALFLRMAEGMLRRLSAVRKGFPLTGGEPMGVCRKRGAWWIDWYEGTRRSRKKTS